LAKIFKEGCNRVLGTYQSGQDMLNYSHWTNGGYVEHHFDKCLI